MDGHCVTRFGRPASVQNRGLELGGNNRNQGLAVPINPVAASIWLSRIPRVGFSVENNRSDRWASLAIKRAKVAGHIVHRSASQHLRGSIGAGVGVVVDIKFDIANRGVNRVIYISRSGCEFLIESVEDITAVASEVRVFCCQRDAAGEGYRRQYPARNRCLTVFSLAVVTPDVISNIVKGTKDVEWTGELRPGCHRCGADSCVGLQQHIARVRTGEEFHLDLYCLVEGEIDRLETSSYTQNTTLVHIAKVLRKQTSHDHCVTVGGNHFCRVDRAVIERTRDRVITRSLEVDPEAQRLVKPGDNRNRADRPKVDT